MREPRAEEGDKRLKDNNNPEGRNFFLATGGDGYLAVFGRSSLHDGHRRDHRLGDLEDWQLMFGAVLVLWVLTRPGDLAQTERRGPALSSVPGRTRLHHHGSGWIDCHPSSATRPSLRGTRIRQAVTAA